MIVAAPPKPAQYQLAWWCGACSRGWSTFSPDPAIVRPDCVFCGSAKVRMDEFRALRPRDIAVLDVLSEVR